MQEIFQWNNKQYMGQMSGGREVLTLGKCINNDTIKQSYMQKKKIVWHLILVYGI